MRKRRITQKYRLMDPMIYLLIFAVAQPHWQSMGMMKFSPAYASLIVSMSTATRRSAALLRRFSVFLPRFTCVSQVLRIMNGIFTHITYLRKGSKSVHCATFHSCMFPFTLWRALILAAYWDSEHEFLVLLNCLLNFVLIIS